MHYDAETDICTDYTNKLGVRSLKLFANVLKPNSNRNQKTFTWNSFFGKNLILYNGFILGRKIEFNIFDTMSSDDLM